MKRRKYDDDLERTLRASMLWTRGTPVDAGDVDPAAAGSGLARGGTAAALAVPADAAPGAAGAGVGEEAFDRPYPYSAGAVYENTNRANG